MGVTEAGDVLAGAADVVAPAGQALGPGGGRVGLDAHVGGAAAFPHVEAGAVVATEHPARGTDDRARILTRPSSRARSWRTTWGCESPPIVPSTARSSPPGPVTSAGERVCGGRRPGPYSAGWPGRRENPMPRLWSSTPVPGTATWLPKPDAFDWIRLTALPSPSAVHR